MAPPRSGSMTMVVSPTDKYTNGKILLSPPQPVLVAELVAEPEPEPEPEPTTVAEDPLPTTLQPTTPQPAVKHTPSNLNPYWKKALFEAAPFVAAAPLTGLALYYCWGRLLSTGTIQALFKECASHGSFKLTRIPLIDTILCVNTNFVQEALDPTNPPYAPGYLASFATCAFIPLIEATRASVTNRVMKNPLLFGISSQLFGRSVVYPAWWANFVSSGSARKAAADAKGSEIKQWDAEATLFAMLICIITPTSALSIMKSRSWMTTWFLYPVTGALIRTAYKAVRKYIPFPNAKNPKDLAYNLTMGSYLLGFVYAASLHIGVMSSFIFKPAELKLLLTPCFNISSQNSLAMNVYRTIQWDAIIVFLSSLGATLSFARTVPEAIKIAVLDFLGVALFGSGAALSGVWAWRETRLKNDREELERQEQPEQPEQQEKKTKKTMKRFATL